MRANHYKVLLQDHAIGSLTKGPDGRVGLRFYENYRALPRRPVLSQSFEDDLDRVYFGKRPGSLPAFFANLLPEGRLRAIQERSFSLEADDDLALFAAVGNDLPGAVSLLASEEEAPLPSDLPEERVEEAPSLPTAGLRFSLAGVQLKFSMFRKEERYTLPARDERGDWIVKIGPTEWSGVPENEYTMLAWARRAGFTVPDHELLSSDQLVAVAPYLPDTATALAVRRYDRDRGGRIHQEDFAQVMGKAPENKYDGTYEQLAILSKAILGEEGYYEFLRRLALTIATGNADAHLKNWSLLYRDGHTPSFTPVYDQLATIAWDQHDRQLGLKLAGVRELGRVDADCFIRLATKAGMHPTRSLEVTKETLVRLADAFSVLDVDLLMLPGHREALTQHWQRVPLLRGVGPLRTKEERAAYPDDDISF